MKDIKAYKPKTTCLTSGQVLMRDYEFSEGELIVKEMMDLLCLEMVDKGVVTKSVTLNVGYSNVLTVDSARGSIAPDTPTNSDSVLIPLIVQLYRKIVNPAYPVRRMNISCNNLIEEEQVFQQLSLFDEDENSQKHNKIQKALVNIKKQFGKNAVFKGMDLEKSATTLERNRQIGGHKSGE